MQKACIQVNKRKKQGKEKAMKAKEKLMEFLKNIRRYNKFEGVRKRNYPLVFLGGTLSAFAYLYQFDIIIFDVMSTKARLPFNSYLLCVALSALGMLGFCMMHKGLTEYWI